MLSLFFIQGSGVNKLQAQFIMKTDLLFHYKNNLLSEVFQQCHLCRHYMQHRIPVSLKNYREARY